MIRLEQGESLPKLKKVIKGNSSITMTDKSTSNLSPFIDDNGIVRVGGRLKRSSLSFDVKHPILVTSSVLSNMIIRHFHSESKHQGRTVTLAFIRNGGYFISHGSLMIRKEISNCVICKRLRGPFLDQVMGDLPKERLHESPPFTNTGLDVFGPYLITEGQTTRRTSATKKLWAVIFTCLVTRATHIEPLPLMDTSSFVNALRRFFAIRGVCKHLRSDNGSNFVGALNQDATVSFAKIKDEVTRNSCTWIMNPPKASHFGGVWERKVQCAKSIINACLLLPVSYTHLTLPTKRIV